MEMKRLTIYGVLQESFKKTFKHFLVCLKGLFVMFLVSFATLISVLLMNWSLITQIKQQGSELAEHIKACGENIFCLKTLFLPFIASHSVMIIISLCVATVVAAWISFGAMRYFLAVYDTGTASIKQLYVPVRKMGRCLLAWLLYALIVGGGLVLLVIPGIYWAIRFSQFLYFIIDANMDVMQSLKMSWAATRGYGWQIFFLMIIIHSISRIGSYTILLLLITIPLHFIVQACIYRKITATPSGDNSFVMQS